MKANNQICVSQNMSFKSHIPFLKFSSVHQFKIQQRLNMIAKVSKTYYFGVNFAQKYRE